MNTDEQLNNLQASLDSQLAQFGLSDNLSSLSAVHSASPSASLKFCPECGNKVNADAKFCPECGAKLGGGFCVSCGAAITPGAKFCPECGAKQ